MAQKRTIAAGRTELCNNNVKGDRHVDNISWSKESMIFVPLFCYLLKEKINTKTWYCTSINPNKL
jgi:hypothetical protein